MGFVYILVGFTRECLNRQTAAGLPSQQLINNSASLTFSRREEEYSALMIVRKERHDLLFAKS